MKPGQLISNTTTYNELLQLLEGQPKLIRRPGSVAIREKAQCIARFAEIENCLCEVYDNGYAVYDNGSRRTVIRVSECSEIKCSTNLPLPMLKVTDEVLGSVPWYIILLMCGDEAIASHTKFPKSIGSTSDFSEEETVKSAIRWGSGAHFDTPEVACIKKEYVEELLSILTEQEFKVVVLYYYEGCKQKEIGKKLEIGQSTVSKLLNSAKAKLLNEIQ